MMTSIVLTIQVLITRWVWYSSFLRRILKGTTPPPPVLLVALTRLQQ